MTYFVFGMLGIAAFWGTIYPLVMMQIKAPAHGAWLFFYMLGIIAPVVLALAALVVGDIH